MKDSKKKKIQEWLQLVPVILMFIGMCALKLWFSVLIFFGIGLIITLITGKRNYCSNLCPLGNLQDLVYTKGKKKRSFPGIKVFSIVISIIFWGYLVFLTTKIFTNSPNLWSGFFSLMMVASGLALLLQGIFSKRFWCAYLCPYGKFLGKIGKLRRSKGRTSKESKVVKDEA